MIIIINKYLKPLEEVDKELENHKIFLKKYYDKKVFICSGRQNPRTGGLIITNLKDKEEAQRIIEEDPFFVEGIASYVFIEVLPTMYQEEFLKLL